ncbi:MAG: CsbD family protein [Burkholderiales bacterium]|jgi:uncharacterized protein YjbJ (UPF0337 family)
MNRDKMVGAAKDVAGRVQRRVGQATDDPAMAARGAAKQLEGKIQKGVGEVKEAVQRVRDDIHDARHTRDTTCSGGVGRKSGL